MEDTSRGVIDASNVADKNGDPSVAARCSLWACCISWITTRSAFVAETNRQMEERIVFIDMVIVVSPYWIIGEASRVGKQMLAGPQSLLFGRYGQGLALTRLQGTN
mmetsp:Transcript_31247/g.46679  ORF Transcript_31247/g.46679 Transcript_31247/m.46679 type:complete len:106 (+) Transcript_31247:2313-2630(+)